MVTWREEGPGHCSISWFTYLSTDIEQKEYLTAMSTTFFKNSGKRLMALCGNYDINLFGVNVKATDSGKQIT